MESNFFGSSLPTPPQPPFGFQVSVSVSPVAEPSSMVLLATGLIAAAWAYRHKKENGNVLLTTIRGARNHRADIAPVAFGECNRDTQGGPLPA